MRYLMRIAVIVIAMVGQTASASEQLTILWAEWDPANYLQELVLDYSDESGVDVVVETVPWSDFQNKAFREFVAQGDAYDMVVGDSQWLGAGSTAGHYVDLTTFFASNKVAEVMLPATVTGYAEYPGNSGKYWAIPLEGDANGFAYRKDWFTDPAEMKAFKAKYGYALDVPKTWAELRDIAEFFHRPKQGRYGVSLYTDNSYDALVMGVENILFSMGADLGDRSTYQVEGIVNSEAANAGLALYRELYSFTPPDWGKTFFQEANMAITEGLAAMSMNYFAFFPALANPAINPHAKDTGYFVIPRGPSGHQFAALGGQGISIVSYSKKIAASKKFLKWFISDKVQQRWAELGGYSTHAATLSSEAFRNATPFNEAFYQSMGMVKDFWSVPEYAELLTAANKHWHPYVVSGKGTAAEANNAVAAEWTAIFKKYGR